MTPTYECCARCGDSYCEPCPQCGACSLVPCGCHPAVSTALGGEGSCEGCGRTIVAGDRIMIWGDDVLTHDVVTHESCPEKARA